MKGLIWYLVKRVLSLLIVVLLIASAVFVTFFIAGGDPKHSIVPQGGLTELRERIVADLKLNEPIQSQYVNFMVKTLSGKFFISLAAHKGDPTSSFIYDSLWKTLALFAAVLIPALIVGFVLGLRFSGHRESMLLSRFARLISLGLASVSIISAALLLYFYYAMAGIVPRAYSAISPWIVSFPIAVGTYLLLMKGKERHFGSMWKGAAPASDKPVPATSITKLYVAWVMVVVLGAELLFDLGGLGPLTWGAAVTRDATVLMACIFLIVVTIAFTNVALDVISPFIKSWFSRRQEPEVWEAPAFFAERKPFPKDTEKLDGGGTLMMVARDYIRRRLGVAALAVVLAILVLGVFAPMLATVPNPDDPANFEPMVFIGHFLNPMAPSFDRSGPPPQKGFIHPLGTDRVGRDVYSELLYGARPQIIIISILVATTLAIGALVWVAAIYAFRLKPVSAMLVGGFSSVVADFVIATPLFVILVARSSLDVGSNTPVMYLDGANHTFVLLLLSSLILVVWACTFRIVRLKMPSIRRLQSSQQTQGAGESMLRAMMPKTAGSILYVSKFVMLFGFLTLPVSGYIFQTGWAWLPEWALADGAGSVGAWWLIFPQVILSALLVGSAYKVLDTFEQVMVRRFGTLQ